MFPASVRVGKREAKGNVTDVVVLKRKGGEMVYFKKKRLIAGEGEKERDLIRAGDPELRGKGGRGKRFPKKPTSGRGV